MALAEVYITFEVVAFLLFMKALEESQKKEDERTGNLCILFSLLSMGLFFALSVASFDIRSIFHGTSLTAWEGVGINFGLGLIAFIFAVISYMGSLKELAEEAL